MNIFKKLLYNFLLIFKRKQQKKDKLISVLKDAKKVLESEVRYRQRKKKRRLPKCPVQFKTSYSEETAKKEASRLEGGKLKLRAYRCEFCPHWHLTHQSNRLKRH